MRTILVLFLGFGMLNSCRHTSGEPVNSSLEATTNLSDKQWDLTSYKNSEIEVTRAEKDAMKKYSSGDGTYARINTALRKNIPSDLKRYENLIKNLASLANKSRKGPCTFYRFIGEVPEVLNQLARTGQTFTEKGFFSSTTDDQLTGGGDDEGFWNLKYIIEGTSENCPQVSQYSSLPFEKEVLFPPGTEFIVTRDKDKNRMYVKEISKK